MSRLARSEQRLSPRPAPEKASDEMTTCEMCRKEVPDRLVTLLADFGLPPLCSRECANIAAELHAAEMKVELKRQILGDDY